MKECDKLAAHNPAEYGSSGSRPPLSLDIDKYQKELNVAELSEEQQREFISTLWKIMVAFVDLGFNMNPDPQSGGGSNGRFDANEKSAANTGGDEHIDLMDLFNNIADQE